MRHTISLCAVLISTACASAQEHYRTIMGVRWWGGDTVSLETFWGLTAATGENAHDKRVNADYVYRPQNNEPREVTLDRVANDEQVQTLDARLRIARTDNAIRMEPIETTDEPMTLMSAHNCRVLIGPPPGTPINHEALGGSLDALVLILDNDATENALAMIRALRPAQAALVGDADAIRRVLERVPMMYETVRMPGNTFAVAEPHPLESRVPLIVLLNDEPFEAEPELGALLDAMTASATTAARAFAPLTVEQLNHVPADGTHSPRWNPEHMAGQQIFSFLQFFSTKDSAFRIEDPRPAGTPAKYVAKNPDWTAQEVVREIERTQEFAMRFAYLLAEIDLDAKPESGGWSLSTMLKRMQWHWGHHTGKLPSKMALPDWPSSE